MSNWKVIPFKYYNTFGKDWLIFSVNMSYNNVDQFKEIPQFYREIVKCWLKSNEGQCEFQQILERFENKLFGEINLLF